MTSTTHIASPEKNKLVAGYVLTALAGLFLAFDTVLKVLRLAPAVQGTTELGYPTDSVLWIGLVSWTGLLVFLLSLAWPSARRGSAAAE
jgi:hypothetical protein